MAVLAVAVVVVNGIILMFAEEARFKGFLLLILFLEEILILPSYPVKYRTRRISLHSNSFSKASRIKNCNVFLIFGAKMSKCHSR